MFGKRRNARGEAAPAEIEDPSRPQTRDPETGLGNRRQLSDLLRREIARCLRYGDASALAVFDVRVAGFRPTGERPEPPSPASFVASILVDEARASDAVYRLDLTHFVVFLIEAGDEGCEQFTHRVRTAISRAPFTRNTNGSGIYVRAWAGWAAWQPRLTTPAAYLTAAMEALERTRSGMDAQEKLFAGRAT
ncbi:MAG: diguanylate cyclase [Thermoflexaceae bacterium]|nr:diguanylate cyclase [Thermoflexaceae bacterium]